MRYRSIVVNIMTTEVVFKRRVSKTKSGASKKEFSVYNSAGHLVYEDKTSTEHTFSKYYHVNGQIFEK